MALSPNGKHMDTATNNTFAANDAAAHFAELLKKVGAGEEVTITERGAPVARLVPIQGQRSVADRSAAIEAIKKLRQGVTLAGLKIRDLIDEGRR